MPALQSSIDAIRIAAAAADRMKATGLIAFDVTKPIAITDIMMIAVASNEKQVLAVAEEIEKDLYLKAGHLQPRSREGLEDAQWILLDFGDFVVHVMHEEAHDYYELERLWSDCPRIDLRLEQAGADGNETDASTDGDDAAESDSADTDDADDVAENGIESTEPMESEQSLEDAVPAQTPTED
jgi:ribosome-associated protein